MKKNSVFGAVIIILVVALGVYGYSTYKPDSSSVSSDVNESAIRTTVEQYASQAAPRRVDIISITPRASGSAFDSYQVEANLVDSTTTPGGETTPIGVQPISLTVEKQNGVWVITAVTNGSYSELPQPVTITGVWECLPHKNQSGPQTTECAFGVAKDQSDGHYAVDTSLMSQYPVDFATGTHVQVTGVVTPVDQLNSVQKYDIDGIIRATSITKI